MELPRVSIVITAYLKDSYEYLRNCVQSVHNIDYPKELLDVVIVTPAWYAPQFDGCKTIHPCVGAYHNPVAVNYGFRETNQDSKHVLMINDDVILTRDSLANMVEAIADHDMILGPISNCDNHGHYDLMFPVESCGQAYLLNERQYRIETIKEIIPEMMNTKSIYAVGLMYPPTLYLYANLFPRKVWNKVTGGTKPESIGFDENYLTGFDDTDYCLRARQRGVKLGILFSALVWHCSGVSADVTMGDLKSERRSESEAIFRKKWS